MFFLSACPHDFLFSLVIPYLYFFSFSQISPVDGRVVHYGFVDEENATIEQVKGVSYSLKDFVGADSPLHAVIEV